MYQYVLVFNIIIGIQAYMPNIMGLKSNSPYINMNNLIIRDLLERLTGKEFAEQESNDPYMDSRESSSSGLNDGLSDKEIPLELPFDYDDVDTINPKTSIRDREYLQHSSLWSNREFDNDNNYKTNDRLHMIKPGAAAAAAAAGVKSTKEEKTDTQLPAYCNPPNPCPVGYTSENNCIEDFENTAAFSRDYQNAQDCMCDSEHMIDCPTGSEVGDNALSGIPPNNEFEQIVEKFQEDNPYFRGEKLPIAAKKGFNIDF